MAFTRSVLDQVAFDPAFGVRRKFALGAEDLDFVYRVFRKGFRLLSSPDILVYHNHGRCTDAEERVTKRGYIQGRGAFYCKHILSGDRYVLKLAYWEITNLIKSLIKNLFKGNSIKEDTAILWTLILGAVYYLADIFDLKGERTRR